MHSSRWRPNRLARFESVESRIYLSGNPAADDLSGLAAVRDEYGLTGSGQTVAVIDTGIAYDHAALGGGLGAAYRVVGGYDFTDERDADPYDDGPFGSHGTHVAGIIGSGSATNPGVAPEVDLLGLRTFDDYGNSYFHWLEEALQWVHTNRNAFENPITTVNISMGVHYNSDTIPQWAMLEDELAQLGADGIFISAGAGNNFASFGTPGLSYPAVSPFVVPVASVDDDGSLSDFSQRNNRVIAAPGRAITSTVPDYVGNFNGITDDYAQYSGTSMAAPYLAGASVLIREAYQLTGTTDVDQQMIYDLMVQTADTIHDPVTGGSYHRLNLSAAIDAIAPANGFGSTNDTLPADTPPTDTPPTDIPPVDTPPVDTTLPDPLPATIAWGTVLQETFDGYRIGLHGQEFTVTAATDGLLTIQAFFDRAEGDVDLELFDAEGRLVASSYAAGDVERADVVASGGQSFTLRATVGGNSVNEQVDFLVTNLVSLTGDSVNVWGTEGDDRFSFAAETSHVVAINGVRYRFDASTVRSVTFNGLGGADTAVLCGTGGDDAAALQPGSADLHGTGYDVYANNVEKVEIRGRSGSDTAAFYDSPGNETFVGTPSYGGMFGDGFENIARGFEEISAHATAGGEDVARLYDSRGNDAFVATDVYAGLLGGGFALHARGFDQVHAFATAGGYDTASLYDSPGNDTYTAGPIEAEIRGDGFFNRAKHFEQVHASATAGGTDTARLFGSGQSDVFLSNGIESALRGNGFDNRAEFFEQVHADGLGGDDRSFLNDTPGNDRLEAAADRAWLTAGNTVTWLYGFEHLLARSDQGGDDTAEIAAVDFLLTLEGAWD